jgi:flagellar motor switch protein FliM
MGEILTQSEVDSLLSGLSNGKIETEKQAPQAPEGIVAYDFANQDRVIRGRMPTFQVINDRFAGAMNTSLSNLLLTKADISSESVETLKFSEFVRSLPVPTSLHVFRMNPLRGHALLVLESQLVYNLIDTFFGGKGTGKAKIEGRDFTSIESVMIRKVVVACLADYKLAWTPVEPVETAFIRSEVNPQFATIVLPSDLVIVSRFEVDLEQSAGKITICLPYAMIEPIRNKLSAGFQSDQLEVDISWQRRFKEIIGDSMVEISVLLGTTEITGDRLIRLKPGDVIQLDQDADQEMIAMVEGLPKFRGHAGIQRKTQAFRIEKKLFMER